MIFFDVTLQLLEGLLYTLIIFASTLICALPLGLVIAFGSKSKSKVLSKITRTFVWIIRGTPLMLQIIFFALFAYVFLYWSIHFVALGVKRLEKKYFSPKTRWLHAGYC